MASETPKPRFIAKEALFIGRARAHNAGDEVPEENIKPNGWTDLVRRADEPAAPSEPAAPPPSKNASKDDWVAYATDEARGEDQLDRSEAEAMTRDELAALFSD